MDAAWHGMAECGQSAECRVQNAECSARRDVPGCRGEREGGGEREIAEKGCQGQGRDRKKEGLPSPASTSIAIPGRRSRSQRQMRIWKYAMLQTRVDGEAVQQLSLGRRWSVVGVSPWGRRDGRADPGAGAGAGAGAVQEVRMHTQVGPRACTVLYACVY